MKQQVVCLCKIALQNIISWARNCRMLMLLLLICVIVSQFCTDIDDFSSSIRTQTNVLGILPYMYSSNLSYFRLVIQLGIILMFSNAPFKTDNSLFSVMRTGYTKWCIGQLLYIIGASLIYVISLFLLTNIFCIKTLGYSNSWGKTFATLRMMNDFVYPITEKIQLLYSPFEAFGHTILLIFMLSVFFGLLIFLMSSLIGRSSGLILSVMLVLLGLMPDFCSIPALIAKISPCSLTQISLLDKTGMTLYPSVTYAYTVLGILIAVLIAANIFIYSNRKIRHKIYAAEV